MKIHPLAQKMPPMTGDEYAALVEDIHTTGRVLDPIWTYKGMILDGAHRYRAALEAGVKPQFQEFNGDLAPESFVISKNVVRRHLTQGQRAILARRSPEWRRVEESRRPGEPQGDGRPEVGETAEVVGRKFSIGRTTMKQAARIEKEDPKLADKVLAGNISLDDAEATLIEPVSKRRESREKDEKAKDRYRRLPETKRFLENIQRSVRLLKAGWASARQEKIDRKGHLPYLIEEIKKYDSALHKIIAELEGLRDG